MCTKCGQTKPVDQFHKRTASPDGLDYKCKQCTSEYYSTYKKRDGWRERNRTGHLVRTYGITDDEYNALLESQHGACAMCQKPAGAFKRRLAVDHDHSCCPGSRSCGKCIRGLLCPACNTFLGKIESGAVTLEQVAVYRDKFAR